MVGAVRPQVHLTANLLFASWVPHITKSLSEKAHGIDSRLPDKEEVGLASNRRQFLTMLKVALRNWQANNASLRAAALAFFTILPLPSLLIMTVTVATMLYGQLGYQQFIQQISNIAGPTIAALMGQLLQTTANPFTSNFNSFISVVFALAGAIGAFGVLQDTLNVIWGVKLPKGRSIQTRIRERLVPFLLVLGAAIIVVVWSELTTLLFNSINATLEPIVGGIIVLSLSVAQIGLSFALSTLLLAIIYKEVPDVEIKWRDITIAALLTGAIFTAVNYLFGWYLRTFPITSVAGAAGALIILLLWFFVIGQVILFGAQFSRTYAERFGSKIKKYESPPDQPLENQPLTSQPSDEALKEIPPPRELDWTIEFKIKKEPADKDKNSKNKNSKNNT